MSTDFTRALALSLVLLSSAASLTPLSRHSSADPVIIDNLDGTSAAIWNFSNPSDYKFTSTELVDRNITLERQPTTWWNSTTQADFSGPDSATNIDLNRWPGDVAMGNVSGPATYISLQPGANGEDSYLDKQWKDTNFGTSTTMLLDGRNPNYYPLMRFDLSSIPAGAVIDGASLSLYQSAGIGNPVTANLHYVIAQWDELQVTWNDRLTGVAWATGGGDFAPRIISTIDIDNNVGWRAWNITQLIDLWHRGRLTNYGLIIEAPNPGATSTKTFYSSDYVADPTRRPKLEVWYRVVGATAEYISKVDGPGTMSVWKNISWNPSVRNLASDEFNGASLDPKWKWTNPPASYDVGVTTPGSLHVVPSIGTDLMNGVFTGSVLSQEVVGDFTAVMKFSADPALNGQKCGLMILVGSREWYGISRTNAVGLRYWRVYATDDAVTTTRVNVISGSSVPAWLRIQRAGNTFTSSTSVDGTTWIVRDSYAPTFEYAQGVRLSFYISDGMSGVAFPADVDYIRIANGNDATVTVQTRIGDVIPVDASWSAWTAPYPTPSTSVMSGISNYVQYRLAFAVTNPGHMAVIGDVNVSWFRFAPAGTIETNDLVPSDLSEWGNFTVVDTLNGQTLTYQYSTDSGGSWTPVIPPADLSGVSVATGKIRFRASLSTTNTLISPTLGELRLSYVHRLDHFYVTASPTATAGMPFTVSVAAKDAANNTIVRWAGLVTLTAWLLDGVTPGGGVLGMNSIVILAGGTATIATETYSMSEIIRINATFGTIWGLSNPIDVAPGTVNHIVVTPDNVTILAFDSQVFTAEALDAFDNPVPGINFTWAIFGGVGAINITWGPIVLFTSNPPIANGTLEASFIGVNGTAQIHVILGPAPWIAISYPSPGDHLTGAFPISYSNSSDSISARFEYDGGAGWILIGMTGVLTGAYFWDTAGLNFTGGSLRAIVTNNRTATNSTVVTPIEVDNTPPLITIGAVIDDQAGSGTITIPYITDTDVVRVDFSYFDGAWSNIGSDFTIDGIYVWTPGVPINGVTVLAIAFDEVGLTGWDEMQGVGSIIVGPYPPSIAPIPDLYVRVLLPYALNLTFYVSDPDTPLASLAIWDSDAANVTANAGTYPSLDVTYGSAGTYNVTLWVSDGIDTAWTIVRIIASALSPPVLVVQIPDVIFDEDTVATNVFSAPATTFFNDPDADPMTVVVLDATNVSSRVNGDDTIDMWSPPDWTGSEMLRLRALDPNGGFAEGAFLVTVRPINDPPVLIAPFQAVTFDEDTTALDVFSGNATTHFFDVEGDLLTISILGGLNIFSRVNPNGTVDLWATADWYGSENLRVRATDPSGEFAEGTFLATVRPVNDPPFVTAPLSPVAFDEDTTATDVFSGPVSAHFSDVDGDTFTYMVLGAVQVSSRINANLTIDLWAAANWHGTENLRVRATDPNGSWVDAPFVVTVRSVNDPPVLATPFPAVGFDEDTIATNVFGGDAAAHFFDVDGDILTITILGGTQVSSRVNIDRTVDMWAAANWSGSENQRVRATDPSGAFAEGAFVVTIRPVNDAPIVLAAIPTVTFNEDTTRLDAFGGSPAPYFFDRDGDPLTFTIVGATNILSRVNTDSTIDFWAPYNWFGPESVSMRATDPSGEYAEAAFLVVVLPINDPPSLAPIPDIQIDDGATATFDVAPYITDVDTNISDISVTTDNQYITVNGRVLTIAFPAGQSETVFTVTISDGSATASRSVRISFSPVWWRNTFMFAVIPFGILLVVGMIAQRARWRPAKAFLVDDRRRLIREFTLDPRCEVTYKQTLQAGALDAVEKAVKVEKYHAQTVQGDALAVCLLAYGPVSLEQVEFAREMLVNVQDKFDEGVKIRLQAAKTAENNLEDANRELQGKWDALHARSKAFAGAVDATTDTMTRLEHEASSIRKKVANFTQWQNRLNQQEQVMARDMHDLEELKASLEKRAQGLERMEATLDEREKNLRSERHELDSAKQEFDAEWRGKSEAISNKEIEIESKEQSLLDKEEKLQSQAEEHALRLSELNSKEMELKEEAENIKKAHGELAVHEEENRKVSKALESKNAEILELEARKAEEFRSWQQNMESQQVLLRQQADTFDLEMKEQQETLENRIREIEQHEVGLNEQRFKIQSDQARLDRAKEDLTREENEVKKAMQTAMEMQEAAESVKKTADQRAAEMEQRERALREEATRLSDEFAKRADMLKSAETELASKQALIDDDASSRIRALGERETELNKLAKSLDARSREVVDREAGIAAAQSSLKELESRLAKEEADLEAAAKRLEAREIDLTQASIRHADESGRLRQETEVVRQTLAKKEAELKSDRERLERESAALHETLNAKALELSGFNERLMSQEAKILQDRQALDAKSHELADRDKGIASAQSSLKEFEARLMKEEADLKATARQFEAKEIDFTQMSMRHADESARLRQETEVVRQSLANKEAELKTEQERLERESAAFRDRLNAKTLELSEFEKSLKSQEEMILKDRQALDAEMATWAASKEKEFNQLEQSRQEVTEQTQNSEKLIEEAQRRAFVATELENTMKRHAEEIRQMEARLEERRLAAETAERQAEAQLSQVNEGTKRLGVRETRLQSMTSELQAREAKLANFESGLSKTSEELQTKQAFLEKEATRLSELQSEIEARRTELDERESSTEAKLADITQREQAIKADFQRLENMTDDLQGKESDVKAREQFIMSIQKDITKRESILSTLETELRRNMQELDIGRKELENGMEAAQASRASADKAREEAINQRARAEKEKAEAENQQKELQKNMKFLQKKAMELLDKEEKLRTKEVKLAEQERGLQDRDDIIQEKDRSLDREREELDERTRKTQAEVAKLKERLAEAEKGTASTAEMEEWRRDIESRVKIVQKKAMDILNREERLRKKESELRKMAEKLGVHLDETYATPDQEL